MTKTDDDIPRLDEATRQAVAALAHRAARRDVTDPADRDDAEAWALEYVMALRGHGWRPTPAKRPPPWRTDLPKGADPADHADELAEAREALAEASRKIRSGETT